MRRRDQRGFAVVHHGIELGHNVALGLETVRHVVAAELISIVVFLSLRCNGVG